MELLKPISQTINFNKYPEGFDIVSEFMKIRGDESIFVEEGACNIGNIGNSFISKDFQRCLGIPIISKNYDSFGFFHALPFQGLSQKDIEKLKPLNGGKFVIVGGSFRAGNCWIQQDLKNILELQQIEPINIETKVKEYQFNTASIHILYRPSQNEIIVARDGFREYNDLLIYSAF